MNNFEIVSKYISQLLISPSTSTSLALTGLKILFLIAFLIYIFFAIVVVRQIAMMSKTFKTPAELTLKAFAYAHLLFSVGIFLLALNIL